MDPLNGSRRDRDTARALDEEEQEVLAAEARAIASQKRAADQRNHMYAMAEQRGQDPPLHLQRAWGALHDVARRDQSSADKLRNLYARRRQDAERALCQKEHDLIGDLIRDMNGETMAARNAAREAEKEVDRMKRENKRLHALLTKMPLIDEENRRLHKLLAQWRVEHEMKSAAMDKLAARLQKAGLTEKTRSET